MKKTYWQIGILTLAFATAGLLIGSSPAYSETAGMERRDDRRDDRQGAQDIRQKGRDVGRETKDQCRDAGGSGPKCRQEKRGIKQDARKAGRKLKQND
ncbi:MAG: hypothetical protein M0R47_07550 [Methylobacter sp.]|uniref:hypothetical protein n=1 Tax=Methylobacter sp. TaxID=2051955 RepID=UPI0025E11972|nr:hypothetical protein [Methylobacter sp.]MCK9620373.1 hypothetical protein [Methylobacter sp.]